MSRINNNKHPSHQDNGDGDSHNTIYPASAIGDGTSHNIERIFHPPENLRLFDIIPDESAISDAKLAAFDSLLDNAIFDEFSELNIEWMKNEFQENLPEFLELSLMKRSTELEYDRHLTDFIDSLCSVYGIQRLVRFVEINNYSPTEWGPVYWRFLHFSSILYSYGVEKKLMPKTHNFALIVRNIWVILPCSVCSYHFSLIKDEPVIEYIVKSIAFGLMVSGTQGFHNKVTENVDASYPNLPNRDMFVLADFALAYKCIATRDEGLNSAKEFIATYIDWQPTTHTLLTTILAAYCQQGYARTSTLLKMMYNRHNSQRGYKRQPIQVQNFTVAQRSLEDLEFMQLNIKQLKWCLMRALLLQFQDTELKTEHITKNKTLKHALSEMYRKYPELIRALTNANLTEPNQRESKMKTLDMLNTIQKL